MRPNIPGLLYFMEGVGAIPGGIVVGMGGTDDSHVSLESHDPGSSPGLEQQMRDSRSTRGAVRVPEFPSNLQWFNTEQPLRLADLRGKLVILDF